MHLPTMGNSPPCKRATSNPAQENNVSGARHRPWPSIAWDDVAKTKIGAELEFMRKEN